MPAFVDFETRSTVELKRTGIYPYAMHPDTDVWCMAWAIDDSEPQLWFPGQPFPAELDAYLAAGGTLMAHNASFERLMWREVMVPRYGWPSVTLEQWYCSAAMAARMALPRDLGGVCNALRLAVQKDYEGYRLMQKMCRPRSFSEDGPVWWDDDPSLLQRLGEYCLTDVRAEQELCKHLVPLPPTERETWLLTERINDTGVPIDLTLVTQARQSVLTEVSRHNKILAAATGGKVTSVTKVAQLKKWLAEQGVESDSLAKKALQEILADGTTLSDDVRDALTARQDAGKSSVAKLTSLLDYNIGGRVHGTLMYCGASTGRWAGRGPQMQNFPRGAGVNTDAVVSAILSDAPVSLTDVSGALRSMVRASPGHRLLIGDYGQIEARVVAWLAGEHKMLEQFRSKAPLYANMAEVIYGRPITKHGDVEEYTVGKSAVLGCGFMMGAAKFQSATGVSEEIAQRAVTAYRETYPHIVNFWKQINQAAILAVQNPERSFRVGEHLAMIRKGDYLVAQLPSRRLLFYAYPSVQDVPMPWDNTDLRPAVVFYSVVKNHWTETRGYGGLWTENVTQAVARDIMRDAALRIQPEYPLVMSVHDELVSEVPVGHGTLKEFLDLMCVVPEWAEGLPLSVEGSEGERWKK